MRSTDYIEKFKINNNEKGIYSIDLCPISNTIRFTAKYDGCIYAYVVGDFNGWKKSEEYKLNWQVDTSDGVLKMIREISFPNGLKPGNYRYKYILIDCDGNEIWIDSEGSEKNSFNFIWENINDTLKIYSSNNIVTYKRPVELIGVCTGLYGRISLPEILWYLETEIDGVKIENGYLIVDNNVKAGTEIIVCGKILEKNLAATKKILVENNKYTGTLVHFYLEDTNYQGHDYIWNCWLFGENCNGEEKDFNFNTDYGFASYIKEDYLIIRKKQWSNNWINYWAEQTNTHDLRGNYKDIYIIYGDARRYTSLKSAIIATQNNIKLAIMDDHNKIKLYLSNEPLLGVDFELYLNGEKVEGTSSIIKGKEVIITNIPKNIHANDLLLVSTSNSYKPYKVLFRNFLDKFYYSKEDLGVIYLNNEISFKLWAPTSYKVELLLYKEWYINPEDSYIKYSMKYDYKTGVYTTIINKDDANGMYYLYKLYFKDVDINGEPCDKITYAVDPYATSVCVNGDKGYVLDINDKNTKPYGFANHSIPQLQRKDDSIIYEMHIRDFTIDESSSVNNNLRGTYLGAVQENTVYKDIYNGKTVKTGLDHLVELGITHVHLMPVFDFGSVDESFSESNNRNWGYDPKNFNVPEGSYSTNPYNPITRIIELREMIMKFHDKGIRVVMDMVYNHMMETTNMDNIVPGYYFRTDYLGRFTNGSGCGNELATERPMVRKFVVDSCMHWIRNYKIDGIRFDLMELIDINTTKEIVTKSSKFDKNFLIYGEPWKGGNSPLINGTFKGSQKNEGFSIFNDTFRDAIRGDNNLSNGFINGNQHNSNCNWNIIEGLKGSIYTLTSNPNESINYADAHDNYTLWDQVEKSQSPYLSQGEFRKNIPIYPLDNHFVRQDLLALSILFTAQGIPFIQCGSEFLRTKQGDHNSYKSCDEINSIKWNDKNKFIDIFNYTKGLINIRKNLPYFNIESSDVIKNKVKFIFANNNENSGVIISHIDLSEYDKGEAVVIYNATSIDNYDVNSYIPISKTGYWNIIANDKMAGLNILEKVNFNEIPKLKSFSIMILCNKINK